MEIREIVIATDGSPASTAALDFGLELALDRGAEAVVLHVVGTHEANNLFSPDRTEPPTQEELVAASEALAQGPASRRVTTSPRLSSWSSPTAPRIPRTRSSALPQAGMPT